MIYNKKSRRFARVGGFLFGYSLMVIRYQLLVTRYWYVLTNNN